MIKYFNIQDGKIICVAKDEQFTLSFSSEEAKEFARLLCCSITDGRVDKELKSEIKGYIKIETLNRYTNKMDMFYYATTEEKDDIFNFIASITSIKEKDNTILKSFDEYIKIEYIDKYDGSIICIVDNSNIMYFLRNILGEVFYRYDLCCLFIYKREDINNEFEIIRLNLTQALSKDELNILNKKFIFKIGDKECVNNKTKRYIRYIRGFSNVEKITELENIKSDQIINQYDFKNLSIEEIIKNIMNKKDYKKDNK